MPPSDPAAVPPPPPSWDTGPADAPPVRYAGFWLRVIAWIIDAIALAVLWQIISLFLPAYPLPSPPSSADPAVLWEYWQASLPPGKMIASAVLSWAYFALQECSSAQATIGKRVLGIRVSTEQGAKLSLVAASVRTWPLYLNSLAWAGGGWLGGLVTLAVFVSCIAVAFSRRKQGLHDKMAGAVLTRPASA
jgi:uncharacterized RDD family membrane protein YckC